MAGTNGAAAFSTIAWKTLRVSHERPQAPPDIDTRKLHSFGIRKGESIGGGYGKRPPRLRRELSREQALERSGRWGRFPQPHNRQTRAASHRCGQGTRSPVGESSQFTKRLLHWRTLENRPRQLRDEGMSGVNQHAYIRLIHRRYELLVP